MTKREFSSLNDRLGTLGSKRSYAPFLCHIAKKIAFRRYILAAKFHILRKVTQTRPKAQNNLKISYLDFEVSASQESTHQTPKPLGWSLRLVRILKNFKRSRRAFADSKPAQERRNFSFI